MTCCDLSDQVRPWATNQHVAVSKTSTDINIIF